MNHRARLMALALGGILAVAESNTPNCPECGRRKARSGADAADGLCPKWWAVRDPNAQEDCVNFSPGGKFHGLTPEQAAEKHDQAQRNAQIRHTEEKP